MNADSGKFQTIVVGSKTFEKKALFFQFCSFFHFTWHFSEKIINLNKKKKYINVDYVGTDDKLHFIATGPSLKNICMCNMTIKCFEI